MITQYRFSFRFYFYSAVTAWTCWGVAAYLSHLSSAAEYAIFISLFGLLGLCGPLVVALYYASKDREVIRDVFSRIGNIDKSTVIYFAASILLMPASILLAMAISIPLGYDSNQFVISGHASFSSGVMPVWFILVMAPIIEELAWHSYGTDCLRRRHNLFRTSIIFAIYWAIWHVPLALINGYYHSNLVVEGAIYGINFLVSLFPFVLLMNWLYYKSNRNILVAVFLHLTANVSSEIFATHPDSKIIQTILLLVLTLTLLYKQRTYFFGNSLDAERINSNSDTKMLSRAFAK